MAACNDRQAVGGTAMCSGCAGQTHHQADVLYIPGLPREWVSAAMKSADVIVLASLGEGSPNTILEAMAHGRPWLATPDCGAANDHAGGVICPLSDFTKNLACLHRNPELREKLGELGRHHWKECYSWDRVVKGWIDIIETGRTTKSFALTEGADLQNKALVRQIRELAGNHVIVCEKHTSCWTVVHYRANLVYLPTI